MNPYQILHIKPGASDAEIQQACRDLVKVWHPNRFAADPRLQKIAQEKLSEINRAYELLADLAEMGRATPNAVPERAARTMQPVHRAAPGLSLSVIWAALSAGILIILCAILYGFLEAPMSALSSITADARRVAQRTGPNIIDEFQGWNGILPQGLDRLLNAYRDPPVSRNVEITRAPASNARQSSDTRGASLLRPGSGEIRVRNRTGEKVQITLATTRARTIALRTLPLPSEEDGTLSRLARISIY